MSTTEKRERNEDCCSSNNNKKQKLNNGNVAKDKKQFTVTTSKEDWLAARKLLLQKEKELSKARAKLAAERQALPWLKIGDNSNYIFQDAQNDGNDISLSQLFGDKDTLIVYHLMYDDKEDAKACHLCSFFIDGINGVYEHIKARSNIVVIGKAKHDKLNDLKKKKNWNISLYSSSSTSFNSDFNVQFTKEQIAAHHDGYNYGRFWPFEQAPGISVFKKNIVNDKEELYHTYSTFAAGLAELNVTFSFLDIIPQGRDEDKGHMWWVKHKESY